jgi:molecular chaperone GrpE
MSDEQNIQNDGSDELVCARQEIERLKKENEEYLNGWKRAKADYANLKNDQEKRSKELVEFSCLSLFAQWVPIVEHLRQALTKHMPKEFEYSEWVKGIENIYKQIKEVMKGLGIEDFSDTVKTPFDPSKHEAVGQEQIDTIDDDIITQEISAGYTYKGRVMVPAKVIVNKKPSNS